MAPSLWIYPLFLIKSIVAAYHLRRHGRHETFVITMFATDAIVDTVSVQYPENLISNQQTPTLNHPANPQHSRSQSVRKINAFEPSRLNLGSRRAPFARASKS